MMHCCNLDQFPPQMMTMTTLCWTFISVSSGMTRGSSSAIHWGWVPCTSTGGWWTGSGSPTLCSPTQGPPAFTPSLSQTGESRQMKIGSDSSFIYYQIYSPEHGRAVDILSEINCPHSLLSEVGQIPSRRRDLSPKLFQLLPEPVHIFQVG